MHSVTASRKLLRKTHSVSCGLTLCAAHSSVCTLCSSKLQKFEVRSVNLCWPSHDLKRQSKEEDSSSSSSSDDGSDDATTILQYRVCIQVSASFAAFAAVKLDCSHVVANGLCCCCCCCLCRLCFAMPLPQRPLLLLSLSLHLLLQLPPL